MRRMTGSPAITRPLLWLSVTHPGRRHAGNQVYSGGLLDALGTAGQPVTLLTQNDGPAISGTTVEVVPLPRLRHRVLGIGSQWPASVWQLAHPGITTRLQTLLYTQTWRALVIDQAACGWAVENAGRLACPLIYIAHNQEGAVRTQVAEGEASPLKRMIMRRDAAKYAHLEGELIRRAHLITAITAADAEAFARAPGSGRVLELKPGYSGPRVTTRTLTGDTPRRVVLVGRFEWVAKQQNLRRWAVEAIPVLARQGIETEVIGTVPEALRRQLQRPGLQFAGPVADLAPHLANARFGLVAEDVGGGFKLKTLDYIFHRLPVAALADNLEGQPAGVIDNALIAETPAGLASGITAAIDDLEWLNRMQQNAFNEASAVFDWMHRAQSFLNALGSLDCHE